MSYSSIGAHGGMVFDKVRNDLYARALRQAVTADSAVLDLGAGLGIHGLVAAAAGARKVYLVEPESVVQVALEVARANGLAGRVAAIQGRIEDIELPEPVDVLVSVMTGNLLFSEDLLPSLFHARDRHLRPGGVMIPDLAELVVVPVSAPALHTRVIGRWSEHQTGLDFSAARRFAANEIQWPRRDDLAVTERLCAPAKVTTVDLTRAITADCTGEALCPVVTSGLCHGLLAWIRLRLNDEWLSADPAQAEVHWSAALLPLDPPLSLSAGEVLQVKVGRPEGGDWTWSVAAAAGTRQHSTFLGHTDPLRRLKATAPQSRPGLGPRGALALRVLTLLQQGTSNAEIARELAETAAISPARALREVQALALRYLP